MKQFFLLFALTIGGITFAQLNYTTPYKWYENQLKKVGETADHSVFVTTKLLPPFSEELTYFTLSTTDAKPTFYKKEKLKIGRYSLRLVDAVQVGDELIELYSGHKYGLAVTHSLTYIARRSMETFDLIGEPKEIGRDLPVTELNVYYGSPHLSLYGDSKGVYVTTTAEGKIADAKPYLKRFDENLKEDWSVDLTEFYARSGIVRDIQFDEKTGMLIYELNLAECDDCGMFKRPKSVNSSIPAVMIFAPNGKQKSFALDIPDGLVYSYTSFFYDFRTNKLTGIFETHEMGKNQFKDAAGSGYAMYQWNAVSGKLMKSKSTRYTYGDIMNSENGEFIKTTGVMSEKIGGDMFPKTKGVVRSEKLSNGDYVLFYDNLSAADKDPYADDKTSEALENYHFLVCLDGEGELKWKKILVNDGKGKIEMLDFTDDNKMIYISHGSSVNYANKDFNYVAGEEKEGDRFIYHLVDLTTGETIARKSFENKTFSTEHTRGITHYNEKGNTIIFGYQSNSGFAGRDARMAAINL